MSLTRLSLGLRSLNISSLDAVVLCCLTLTVLLMSCRKHEGTDSVFSETLQLRRANDANHWSIVRFSNDCRFGLIGGGGSILSSIDSGLHWSAAFHARDANYRAVFISTDGMFAWAASTAGDIHSSRDGLRTWKNVDPQLAVQSCKSIWFDRSCSNGIITTDRGVIITRDSGKSWKRIYSSSLESFTLYGAFIDKDTIIVHADNAFGDGLILRYVFGKSWEADYTLESSINELRFNKEMSIGWAVGNGISRYDRKNAWTGIDTLDGKETQDSISTSNDVAMSEDGQHVIIVGRAISPNDGQILISHNHGVDWVLQKSDRTHAYAPLQGVWSSESGEVLWCVGNAGTILKSTNFGETWVRIDHMTFQRSYWTAAIDPSAAHLFIAGDSGSLLMSQDKGRSWVESVHFANTDVKSISIDRALEHIAALSADGKVYLSSDTGVTWTTAVNQPSDTISEKVLIQNKNLWVVGRKKNSGRPMGVIAFCDSTQRQWRDSYIGGSFIRGIDISGSVGFAVGDTGKVVHSTDGGLSWDTLPSFTNHNLSCVKIFHDGRVLVAGGSGFMAETTNDGRTWDHIDSVANTYIYSLHFDSSERVGIFTGSTGYAWRSVDGGRHWFKLDGVSAQTSLTDAAISNGGFTLAVGWYGNIFTSTEKGSKIPNFNFALKEANDSVIPVLHSPSLVDSDRFFVRLRYDGPFSRRIDSSAIFQQAQLRAGLKPIDVSSFQSNAKIVAHLWIDNGSTSIEYESTLQLGETMLTRFARLMGWSETPSSVLQLTRTVILNIGIPTSLYYAFLLGLFFFSPKRLLQWHEWIASREFPFQDKLIKALLPIAITSDRVLSAYMRDRQKEFVDSFLAEQEVSSRPAWVPLPLKLNTELLVPNSNGFVDRERRITVFEHINSQVETQDRWRISVEGPGGIGKSTFAFNFVRHLVRISIDQSDRPVIPVVLNSVSDGIDSEIKQAITAKIGRPVSDDVLTALISNGYVIAIIDGISEMERTKTYSNSAALASKIIVTSRTAEKFESQLTVRPKGIAIANLDSVLDGFIDNIVGNGYFGEKREILRVKVRELMMQFQTSQSEEIPVIIIELLLRLGKQYVDDDQSLDDLPDSLSALTEQYVLAMLRTSNNSAVAASKARLAAIICLGLNLQSLNVGTVLSAVELRLRQRGEFLLAGIEQSDLDLFVESGLMVSMSRLTETFYKFFIDPVAEELAAMELVLRLNRGQIDYETLRFILASLIEVEGARGFRSALSRTIAASTPAIKRAF